VTAPPKEARLLHEAAQLDAANGPTPSRLSDPDWLPLVAQLARCFSADTVVRIDWDYTGEATVTPHALSGAAPVPVSHPAKSGTPPLPWADDAFDLVFNLASLNHLVDGAVVAWLGELRRVTRHSLWLALEARPDRNRAWWETRFFAAGFRKHPLLMQVQPYDSLYPEGETLIFMFEKIPAEAFQRYPLSALAAERDLHMDMLRETGPRSDAHLARYQLAAQFAQPRDVIVDLACGLGYGSALLARQFPTATVIGVDNSPYGIAYARQNFARNLSNLEFHQADACDLRWLGDRQVDFVVSFETLEHLPDPEGFLTHIARRMAPEARFIGSVPNLWVDETGKDPNPFHLHVFDLERCTALISRHFSSLRVYRQNAERGAKGDHGRILRPIVRGPQADADRHHAEWWVVAAQGVVAQPAVHLAGTSLPQTLPDDDQLDLWLDEALTVCGEGRALVAGPGATRMVGRLLHRGVDAWGVDTARRASAATHGGRCLGGRVTTLPLERGPFRSVLFLGALDELDEPGLGQVLGQLRRAVEGSLHVRVFTRVAGRDRRWWETTILQAGFRKHPIRPPLRPGEGPNPGDPLAFYFERLTDSGTALDGSPASVAILDPSRNAGREGDLILARYQWAAALVRPWDTVLDLGCGCGCGTHILRRSSRGARFIGVDAAANAIDYAQAHFAAPIVEFRCCPDPAEILMELPEASVDFAVCALPLDDLESVDGLLSGTQRILAPGGRLVFTVAGHSTAFGAGGLRSQLAGRYLLESVHRQAGDELRPESADLHEITLAEVGLEEAEAWLLVVMKDPLMSPLPAYRETAFRHVAAGEHAAVLRYPEFYANPWILHALVHGGWRMSSQRVLAETLQRLLQEAPEDSADAGAALCILLYRVIAGVVPTGREADLLVRQAERFRNLPAPNAHQFRWQLSITFALAQLALHQGALDRARELFGAVGAMDVFKWGPSLATKASEALFNAGWIAWCAEDLDSCRQFWTQGLELGRRLLARPLDETLINPQCPNLFCAGDGMRELVYALENVGRCGHGLHALHLREQGISCSWEPIFNSFRWQLERSDTSLRLAQRELHRAGELHAAAVPCG